VPILFAVHPRFADHDAGRGHPERPARLEAVIAGATQTMVVDALVMIEPRAATVEEMQRVHPAGYLGAIERFCAAGGGRIDDDTAANGASYEAATFAAGAGLTAIEALDRGEGEAAFCAVRPPGHHATPSRAMGFCLVNNAAVAAANLAARGERVLLVDIDAHHGNGTQDAFYERGDVFYVSFHEWPLYPGTGRLGERGQGDGINRNLNFPLPEGATGDVYLRAIDDVLAPLAEGFDPTWLVISAGFDAHRRDPLTGLLLSSGDYGMITERLLEFAPAGRRLVFLEGGYDLQALADSTAASLGALAGIQYRPEAPTSGGAGDHVVDAARQLWTEAGVL
jgi:acetoin utilization deacetylase AcuC-like enzyme